MRFGAIAKLVIASCCLAVAGLGEEAPVTSGVDAPKKPETVIGSSNLPGSTNFVGGVPWSTNFSLIHTNAGSTSVKGLAVQSSPNRDGSGRGRFQSVTAGRDRQSFMPGELEWCQREPHKLEDASSNHAPATSSYRHTTHDENTGGRRLHTVSRQASCVVLPSIRSQSRRTLLRERSELRQLWGPFIGVNAGAVNPEGPGPSGIIKGERFPTKGLDGISDSGSTPDASTSDNRARPLDHLSRLLTSPSGRSPRERASQRQCAAAVVIGGGALVSTGCVDGSGGNGQATTLNSANHKRQGLHRSAADGCLVIAGPGVAWEQKTPKFASGGVDSDTHRSPVRWPDLWGPETEELTALSIPTVVSQAGAIPARWHQSLEGAGSNPARTPRTSGGAVVARQISGRDGSNPSPAKSLPESSLDRAPRESFNDIHNQRAKTGECSTAEHFRRLGEPQDHHYGGRVEPVLVDSLRTSGAVLSMTPMASPGGCSKRKAGSVLKCQAGPIGSGERAAMEVYRTSGVKLESPSDGGQVGGVTAGETAANLHHWSLAALAAATTADIASSWGHQEANPRLQSADGSFGARGLAIKAGVIGAVIGVQWVVAKRWPGARRWLAVSNFASAGVTGAVAVRNWRMQ